MLDNKGKAKLLGMPFGTANNRLKKMLLFKLAERLGLTDCYRCGGRIFNIDDFTVEHKEPWGSAKDPVEAFFDLDNVAFSHMKCNYSAAKKTNRKYDTKQERKRAQFLRYYKRNTEQVLSRKRDRYRRYKQTKPS